MAKILIIGCGDIGGALAESLMQDGHQVTGLKRSLPNVPSAINYIQADITKADELESLPLDVDQVVYILSPSSGDISAYEDVFKFGVDNVLAQFEKQKSSVSFTFVSSTRVYGQNKGEWLNEASDTKPTDDRGKILLAAENKFLNVNNQTTIVRFSGIYGRSNDFINQLKSGADIQKKPPYFTNRIHRADCIGALAFIINKKSRGHVMQSIYLATDADPASKWDVACYLADALSIDRPAALKLKKGAGCNKRLANDRLKSAGYQFKYKSYKQGYQEAINEGI